MSLLPPQLSSGPRHSFCWPLMAAHPRGKGTRLLPLSPQMPCKTHHQPHRMGTPSRSHKS
ncbi:hypothetical protein BC831DRAFT_479015 [Entophlyctis helioformis]|nr:hypothetical protein BC831DRAFT_479015 [Entophlyctis helioformis]